LPFRRMTARRRHLSAGCHWLVIWLWGGGWLGYSEHAALQSILPADAIDIRRRNELRYPFGILIISHIAVVVELTCHLGYGDPYIVAGNQLLSLAPDVTLKGLPASATPLQRLGNRIYCLVVAFGCPQHPHGDLLLMAVSSLASWSGCRYASHHENTWPISVADAYVAIAATSTPDFASKRDHLVSICIF
ncbi:hypothetical protein, partial [Gellertiella hungarica]|uniref:hypothetical protein n=1 Tax=Gellertiella hungarica TaxID=1572859 RepID=UPI001AED343F